MSFVTAVSRPLTGRTSHLTDFAPNSRTATGSPEGLLTTISEALRCLKSVAGTTDRSANKVGIGSRRAEDTFLLLGGPRAVAAAYGG